MKRKALGTMFLMSAMFVALATDAHALANSETADARAADEAAIRANVKQMEDGWNAKSGALFAKPFAEDADYVIINGMHVRGRRAIDEGHQRIFATIFKDSTLKLSVKQVRFLRPDVALVHVNGGNRLNQAKETREVGVILTLVMVKEEGSWKIAAFQNTRDESQAGAQASR